MNTRLSSFKNYLESQGKSKSTIDRYVGFALDFLSFLDRDNTELENATAKEVMAFLSVLQTRGLSTTTRAIRLGVINHLFDYQLENGERESHPSKHIKLKGANTKKLTPILSKVELETIYKGYATPTKEDPNAHKNWFRSYTMSKHRNRVILSLLVYQGLTTKEIEMLQLSNLQLREGEIYIEGSRRSNARTLKLKSHQIMDLMEYVYQLRPQFMECQMDQSTNRLFLSAPRASSDKAHSSTLSVWKRLTTELKAQHPSFINLRQLRTSRITHWLLQYNLREVQQMAGHKYVSTTEGYYANQMEDLQADVDKFHPLG